MRRRPLPAGKARPRLRVRTHLAFDPPVPLSERLTRAAGYWFLGFAGGWLLALPPESVTGEVGIRTLIVWAAMFFPGLVCGVFVLRGKVLEEYVSLLFVAGGVAFYATFLWITLPTALDRGFVAMLITTLLLKLINRFLTLHRQVKEWKRQGKST